MDAILLIIGITEFSLNQYNNALGKYFTLSTLSYHFSPFENENYHRFIISLQANNLTSLSPYATDLTSDRLFHHFKAIYQFPKHIIVLVKIVANATLI
jgi:hypothetical protein